MRAFRCGGRYLRLFCMSVERRHATDRIAAISLENQPGMTYHTNKCANCMELREKHGLYGRGGVLWGDREL